MSAIVSDCLNETAPQYTVYLDGGIGNWDAPPPPSGPYIGGSRKVRNMHKVFAVLILGKFAGPLPNGCQIINYVLLTLQFFE